MKNEERTMLEKVPSFRKNENQTEQKNVKNTAELPLSVLTVRKKKRNNKEK
jgi:hypothetical protein